MEPVVLMSSRRTVLVALAVCLGFIAVVIRFPPGGNLTLG